ncbi:hypothetical protein [Micromonospora sp. KC606]|uniref:hypothetical protein n=1 Tax=Micromonospora sp. KC606 TaxID=2530379 RepID=UPI001A9D6AC7|nr:hypothetical protein [Micromonospora sp. KC606]
MGRRPKVFVRQVSMAEGQRLQKITQQSQILPPGAGHNRLDLRHIAVAQARRHPNTP